MEFSFSLCLFFSLFSFLTIVPSVPSLDMTTPSSLVFENFWQNLPEIFTLSVIEHLDYKSRCCLEKCSKENRSLVKLVPVFMEHTKIKLGYQKTAKLIFNDNNDDEDQDCYPAKNIIQDFLTIFENPRSLVNQIELNGFARGHDPQTLEFFEQLLTEVQGKNVQLNVRKFHFFVDFLHNEEIFADLVRTMNPESLKSITILHEVSRRCLELLKDTEQWRNSKKIGFGDVESLNFDWLMHLEKIRFTVKEIFVKDLWMLLQNFLTKNLPIQSYFDINLNSQQNVQEVLAYFAQQNVIVKNEPTSPRDAQLHIHTQRFKFANNEDKVLILKLNAWRVCGFVGRASRYQ